MKLIKLRAILKGIAAKIKLLASTKDTKIFENTLSSLETELGRVEGGGQLSS